MSFEKRTPVDGVLIIQPLIEMVKSVKADLTDAVEKDERAHQLLSETIGEVRDLTQGQNVSLLRIEDRLKGKQRAITEATKNKREWIKVLGALLLATVTGIVTHYLGS